MSTKPETKTEDKPEVKFASFCGFEYDPAKKADCILVCKGENPEEYDRCVENFKIKPTKKTAKKSAGKGKSKWGHVNGSQAGLIDDCLENATKLVTLEEIQVCAGANSKARTLHHLKHLVNDKGVDVQMNKDKKIFWVDGKVKAKAAGSITTMFLRKPKAEKPETKKDDKVGDKTPEKK